MSAEISHSYLLSKCWRCYLGSSGALCSALYLSPPSLPLHLLADVQLLVLLEACRAGTSTQLPCSRPSSLAATLKQSSLEI